MSLLRGLIAWHSVEKADQLAAAIHDGALGKYPESDYAKLYGTPSP
jgi:hypothetical protein